VRPCLEVLGFLEPREEVAAALVVADGDRAALPAVGVVDGVVARFADRRLQIVDQLGAQEEGLGQDAERRAHEAGSVEPAVQTQVEAPRTSRNHVRVLPGDDGRETDRPV
jgi:hypothetical protein